MFSSALSFKRNNSKERFGDQIQFKRSYLGRDSQRQRKKQEGYKHHKQVFLAGQDNPQEARHGVGAGPVLKDPSSAAGGYINTWEY